MKNTLLIVTGIVIAVSAATLGYVIQQNSHHNSVSDGRRSEPDRPYGKSTFQDMTGQVRPLFSLTDLDGNLRQISEWDNRVLVINFWATWCPPCRDEIPGFIELQKQYGDSGLQFIGIALEKTESAASFGEELGINYPILAGELDAIKIAEKYGNRIGALPYTVFIDRNKIIRHVQKGVISHAAARKIITDIL